MKIYLPHNIFTTIFATFLKQQKISFEFQPSALLTSAFRKDQGSCALIPVMDLLKHDELFVSSRYGLSFDGPISNSYIYYKKEKQDTLERIRLFGDISSQEAVLTNIMFKELYDAEVKMEIAREFTKLGDENYLLAGDINFSHSKMLEGFSFAEEIMEITELPYVNYILAAEDNELLERANKMLTGAGDFLKENTESFNFAPGWEPEMKDKILENAVNFIFDFDESDIEGVKSQLRMAFFYGISEEIVEPKFV